MDGTVKKRKTGHLIVIALLVLLAIICLLPFYIMIINSTRSNIEIVSSLSLIPSNALSDNYKMIMERINIWKGFLNSITITIPSVFLAGYFGALTGYGFSKFKFKGNKFLFWMVLATLMIPMQLGLVGYYRFNAMLGLINTYWPLILPWIATPGTVFFMKMYTDSTVSDSLLEAARIDGAGEWFIFNRIVLPILKPAVATMGIFNFVSAWNNYLMPLTLLYEQKKYPLPVLISMLKGVYSTNYGAIYLGVSISIVPIIIVFFSFSKNIIGGLTVGAVKG